MDQSQTLYCRRDLSWQRAVAVRIGSLLRDGRVLLAEGVETPGVVWETPAWRLSDSGLIYFKNVTGGGGGRLVKGVQYFGLLDDNNVFRPTPETFKSLTLSEVCA